MAPICALGSNHEELFQNLCDKKRVIERIDKNTPARKKIRASWYVPYPNLEDDLFREKLAQVKTRGSTSAYAATKASLLALQDAGLEQADEDAVVFIGNDSFSMGEFTNEILRFEQEQKMNIMVVPMTMQSSIDSWVTIALGTHGMSSVLNMACASATTAVGWGYDNIQNGTCSMAICGGTTYISDKNKINYYFRFFYFICFPFR